MSANLEVVQEQRRIGYKMPPPGWQPGQSGNPGGRPRGAASITVCYDRLMTLPIEELRAFVPSNGAEAAALKQALNSVDGKPLEALPSLKEITDRTEGKAPQKLEISGELAIQTEQMSVIAHLLCSAYASVDDPVAALESFGELLRDEGKMTAALVAAQGA